MSKYGVISGPYFPVSGLNTEIYSVNLRIQPEYRKIRTRNNSVFGHVSHCVVLSQYLGGQDGQDLKRLRFFDVSRGYSNGTLS